MFLRKLFNFPRTKLCLLIIVLGFFNYILIAAYPPSKWRLSRLTSIFMKPDISTMVLNGTQMKNFSRIMYEEHFDLSHLLAEQCPEREFLTGKLALNFSTALQTYQKLSNFSAGETISNQSFGLDIQHTGAFFEPIHCRPTHTVAIIIPFRDRQVHLRYLLGHLIPILQRQLLRYSIFVVSQMGYGIFNKGRLMNTGFLYATKTGHHNLQPFDCFIFHDVDLLPEYDTLLYRCPEAGSVKHLSISINKFEYHPLCCGMTVGGVLAFWEKAFRTVNGYSNTYWGWGGEDDDMNARIRKHRLNIDRPNNDEGRYTMIKHDPDKGNPWNSDVDLNLRTAFRRFHSDGLSNLDTRINSVETYSLFTNIWVDVRRKP